MKLENPLFFRNMLVLESLASSEYRFELRIPLVEERGGGGESDDHSPEE